MKKTVGIISCPTFGKLTADFHYSQSALQKPLASSWIPYSPRNKRIDDARNESVDFARMHGAEYIMFIDDDVLVPPYALLRMLERNKDIVNGVYVGKNDVTPLPLLFREQVSGSYLDWKMGEFIQIDSAGCGCTLIKTSVFDRLEKPYFQINFNLTGAENSNYGQGTEDLFFYGKCRKAGIEVWADTSIQCGHIDINSGNIFIMPLEHPCISGEEKYDASDIRILDLGCGSPQDGYHYYGENAKITRVDIREEVSPDLRMDIRCLEGLKDESYDIVNASNVLPFFNIGIIQDLVREWFKKVKIGGKLQLTTPNMTEISNRIIKNGALDPQLSSLLHGNMAHRKDVMLSCFTEKMLKAVIDDSIHGADLSTLVVEADKEGLMLKASVVRNKTSYAYKDQGVNMYNLINQDYEVFAINESGQYLSKSNTDLKSLLENIKSMKFVGLNGKTLGDQIGFNTQTGSWYRNGKKYDSEVAPASPLNELEFEVVWKLPKSYDPNNPNCFYSFGYRTPDFSNMATVLPDGSVNFVHKIHSVKLSVTGVVPTTDKKPVVTGRKTIAKKSSKKKAEKKVEKKKDE